MKIAKQCIVAIEIRGFNMRKNKRLKDVFMREVTKSIIKVVKSEKLNAYITYKHVVDTTLACKTYINGRKITILDKGYTILEYSPIEQLYNVRIFIDDKDHILLYYFDIIGYSEFKAGEIFYEDMYLDVLYNTEYATKCSNYITLEDEGELISALKNNEITQEEYEQSYDVANKLMAELLDKKNMFVNRNLIDYNMMKKEINN